MEFGLPMARHLEQGKLSNRNREASGVPPSATVGELAVIRRTMLFRGQKRQKALSARIAGAFRFLSGIAVMARSALTRESFQIRQSWENPLPHLTPSKRKQSCGTDRATNYHVTNTLHQYSKHDLPCFARLIFVSASDLTSAIVWNIFSLLEPILSAQALRSSRSMQRQLLSRANSCPTI